MKYAIRGAKVFSLELDIPGWTVDEVGPPRIVDTKTLAPDEDARLIVPLLEPTSGDVEITIKARRAHSRNPDDIQINLPTLVADSPKPATVVVLPADNVELATRSDQLVGLSPQGIPAGLQLPHRRQPPLIFRAERSPSKYVAGLSVQPQKISVRIETSARIEADHIDVEQRFGYQVLYEPVERLHLVVPSSFGPPKNWQVTIGDRPLTPILVATSDDLVESTRYQVPVGAPRLGQVELVSRYTIPLQPANPKNGHSLNLPLPMPLEGELTSNVLTLDSDGGLRTDLRPGSWTVVDPTRGQRDSRRFSVASPTAATSVPLSISVEEQRPVAESVVERGWIQTWLLDNSRQERAVFRMRSRDSAVTVTLPPDVSTSDMEAMLDGRPVQPTLNGQRRLSVDWPSGDAAHVLELRYRFSNVDSSWRWSANTAPQFDDNVHVRRIYWQVVVPGDRHLLAAHSATPEFQWRWDGLAYKRVNLIDQAELEHWATGGAAPVEAPVPESANVYLFSATRPENLELWIGRRSIIVFVASAILLLAALLLMRFSVLRRAWTLAALGIALIVFALAFPDLAILLGQASAIGLLLAGLGVVLRGVLHRHVASEDSVHSGSSLVRDHGVTELYYQPAPPPVSTTSGALAVERSATESHAG